MSGLRNKIIILLTTFVLAGCGKSLKTGLIFPPDNRQISVAASPPSNAATNQKQKTSGGIPDESFGNKGKIESSAEIINPALRRQADGSFTIAGITDNKITLTRYSAAGKPDESFGKNGAIIIGDSGSQPPTFAFTPDNKLLAISKRGSNIEIREYLPDGSPDKSFGKNGQINAPIFSSISVIRFLNDNSFLIAGDNKAHNFTISGFTPNGQPNLKFGKRGTLTTRFGEPYSYVAAISPQADNKFIAAGFQNSNNPAETAASNDAQMVLARYTAEGKPDASFGKDGKVEIETPANEIENFKTGSVAALDVQKDGKITLAGQIDLNFGIVRLLPDGKLDSSFGKDGFVATVIGKEFYQSNIMQTKLQPDGKIITAGYANRIENPSDSRFVIARFLSNGQPDTSFGTNGFIISDFNVGDNGILDMFVEPDGKLIIGGVDKNKHIFLMRYSL